jgi:hypothetical protein
MNRRAGVQIGVLLLLPLTSFLAVAYLFRDAYLPISAAYLALIVVIQFVDLESFLHFRNIQRLWARQAEVTRRFVFDPAQYQEHGSPGANIVVVEVTSKVLLRDANLVNAAKLKYLVGETGAYIPSVKDEFKKMIFINIALLVALMIFTPVGPKNRLSESASVSMPSAAHSGPSTLASRAADHSRSNTPSTSDPRPTASQEQVRLGLSYFAVVLQIVWIARVLFLYRQKNGDHYFQVIATE